MATSKVENCEKLLQDSWVFCFLLHAPVLLNRPVIHGMPISQSHVVVTAPAEVEELQVQEASQ
jgi:hypothetical protein